MLSLHILHRAVIILKDYSTTAANKLWKGRIYLLTGDVDKTFVLKPAGKMPIADRFLLIKAYGAGFWCDMDHVVGGLLFAEIAGRIPVVYWGKNSIYGGSDDINAFEQFFLPVSEYTVHDLIRKDYTVCPEMWNVNNLISEEAQQFIRTGWYPPDMLLARPEEVLVIGSAPLYQIQPWLQHPHPAFGAGPEDIYRYIFAKYIKVQPYIVRELEGFYAANMKNRHNLAVHVRGSDKITEVRLLHQINKLYHAEIANYLVHNPSASIFLLTESELILEEYKHLYKERLIITDCQRTGGDDPIYFKEAADKKRMGIEVLQDVYLAINCDSFIGNAHSNVSNAIVRLKRWPTGSSKLFSLNDI